MPTTKPRLAPGEARRVAVDAVLCRCARCDHRWTVLVESASSARGRRNLEDDIPTSCARCKSRSWRLRPGSVPLGRKPPQ